mmetsp:Transcript_96747/g.153101  ORF Transcript_96747/g.153101 Transcript_96747/m.153101 type:complete len:133 (-) Transcript_96747:281-679(-)
MEYFRQIITGEIDRYGSDVAWICSQQPNRKDTASASAFPSAARVQAPFQSFAAWLQTILLPTDVALVFGASFGVLKLYPVFCRICTMIRAARIHVYFICMANFVVQWEQSIGFSNSVVATRTRIYRQKGLLH